MNEDGERKGRIGRAREWVRDDYVEQRRSIDDWVAGSGVWILLGVVGAIVVFAVLAAFRVPL